MKTYHCYRVNGYPRVDVIEGARKRSLLPGPSFKAANHSQDFDWGFAGSSADQLAVAILMDIYDDRAIANKFSDSVKWTLLATAPRAGVSVTGAQVSELVKV